MKTGISFFAAAAAALCIAVGPAAASGAQWSVDKAASSLGFSASQGGRTFSGGFSAFDATIVFDPADLAASHVEVRVETASAKTGDRQRDAALPTADWFASKSHPAAIFRSDRISKLPDGSYAADGTLMIRGVSRPLRLPFTVEIAGDRATANGEVTIVRTDFGVGQGEFATDEWVGLDVKVRFRIVATR